jgi:hypothetical protein
VRVSCRRNRQFCVHAGQRLIGKTSPVSGTKRQQPGTGPVLYESWAELGLRFDPRLLCLIH